MVERGIIGSAISRVIKEAELGSKQRSQAIALNLVLRGLKVDGFKDPSVELSSKTEDLNPIYEHTLFSWDTAYDIVTPKNGREAHLTKIESQLLEAFVRRTNELMNTDSLEEEMEVKNPIKVKPYTGRIKWHVANLRGKIEPDPKNPEIITTIKGRGYVFRDKRFPNHVPDFDFNNSYQ